MSITTGTFPGVRIVDMPDLGTVTDTSSLVGERAGSGRFSAASLRAYSRFGAVIVINVKDYGATGNGTTDDTTAIRAAITAAGAGNTVFFPAGTYKTTAAIALAPRVSIAGAGPSSIIAPATEGQSTFTAICSSDTELNLAIHDIQIQPTVAECKGVVATYARNFIVRHCVFSGCGGMTIEYDRCTFYQFTDCVVKSRLGFYGGTIRVISSVWSSVNPTAFLGGYGIISRIQFLPEVGAWAGQGSPAIHVVNQPVTHVFDCSLAWGAYGGGVTGTGASAAPATFLVMEGQCQGNIIARNVCLGTGFGIILGLSQQFPDSICPTFVEILDNQIDSFCYNGILIAGTATWPALAIKVQGNVVTETQRPLTSATPSAAGSGYQVGDVLTGPAVPAQQEGAPAMLQVTAVGAGGGVTTVAVYNNGLTQSPPASPVTFSGGSGTGAQFNVVYGATGAGIWASFLDKSGIIGNTFQNYGGVSTGYGIVLDTVTNTQVTDNHITDMASAIHGFSATNGNIIFSHNICTGCVADFGGNPPVFSLMQDNLGFPWLTTTPTLPASGVAVTNTAPYPQEVFIYNGVVTGINVNGIPVNPGAAPWTIIFTLRPQHTISITYSAAPTWAWLPLS